MEGAEQPIELRKKIILLIFLPLLVGLTLYGGGIIAQFIINYNAWQESGNLLGNGTAPEMPDTSFAACLAATFHWPEGLISIGLVVVVLLVLVLFVFRIGRDGGGDYDSERKLTYAHSGSYGTAGFMGEKEMKEALLLTDVRTTDATILGKRKNKVICLPNDSRLNRNFAIYGASGSGKSRAFVRNMVLQAVRRGESVIITDPKSELFEDMAAYLSSQGYIVRVFNLIRPQNSDSWNCLNEVEDEMMAQVFADTIIKNTSGGKGDHFWDNSELNLLKALILYVRFSYPDERRNIGEVYQLLCNENEAALTKMIGSLPPGHPAKAPYNIFKQAADSVRGGVIIGLGSRLQIFQSEAIRKITSFDEIDLELPAREKCAYFCITSDQNSAFDYLSSLFFSCLFIRLVGYADSKSKSGKCDVPVCFILDEHPNSGLILDFNKKISVTRSRAISVSVIFQNLAQMKNRYPNDVWQEILGNCDIQIALGCTDSQTADLISERTGDITIGVQSTARVLSSWQVSNYTTQYRETEGLGRRKLMTMDEVLRMSLNEELVILRGHNILKCEKFDFSLHPDSKYLVKVRASEYVPAWRANEEPGEPASRAQPEMPQPERAVGQTDEAAPAQGEPPAVPPEQTESRSAGTKSGRKRKTYRKMDEQS